MVSAINVSYVARSTKIHHRSSAETLVDKHRGKAFSVGGHLIINKFLSLGFGSSTTF